jgi:glycine cleavage system H protein
MTEYDDGRIWYKKKGKVITLGLTEKAFDGLGEVESVSLPSEGDEINQDDVIGEVSGTKVSFEIITPVDGSIIAVNDELNDNLDLLVEDPLDEGWICQIRMDSNVEDAGDEEEEESE